VTCGSQISASTLRTDQSKELVLVRELVNAFVGAKNVVSQEFFNWPEADLKSLSIIVQAGLPVAMAFPV
jgi:hypothetical protein